MKTAPIHALSSIASVADAPLARTEPVEAPARLFSDFATQIDRFSRAEWDSILAHFRDASLYQCGAYSAVRWGEKNLSRLALTQGAEILGAAQVILVRLPVLKAGLAYVKWGPLWQVKDGRRELAFSASFCDL